jgi:hypothetical protein
MIGGFINQKERRQQSTMICTAQTQLYQLSIAMIFFFHHIFFANILS